MEHDIPLENSNRENGTTFLDFPLFLGIFQWDEPTKRVPFTAEPEIPEILTKWKAPIINLEEFYTFCPATMFWLVQSAKWRFSSRSATKFWLVWRVSIFAQQQGFDWCKVHSGMFFNHSTVDAEVLCLENFFTFFLSELHFFFRFSPL